MRNKIYEGQATNMQNKLGSLIYFAFLCPHEPAKCARSLKVPETQEYIQRWKHILL